MPWASVGSPSGSRWRAWGWECRISSHRLSSGSGDARADPPRSQDLAVLARGGGHDGARLPAPARGQGAVEEAGEVGDVVTRLDVRDAVQGGVDAQADDPHPSGAVDEDVLGVEPAVGDPGAVGGGDRAGDLGDQPGRAARAERPGAGRDDVERGTPAPLVDDVADLVGDVGVEDTQDPGVQDGRRASRGGHQVLGPWVVGADDVDRHVPLEHPVVGPPEPAVAALAEEVHEPVAVGEDVPGPGRVRHQTPSSLGRVGSGPRRS